MTDTLIDGIPPDQFADEKQFYIDSGAAVAEITNADGTISLLVSYAEQPVDPPHLDPTGGTTVDPPISDGYVLVIQRIRTEQRGPLRRTVGVYQAFLNGDSLPDVQGFCVERPGPGDNSQNGVNNHLRIAAGTYPLFTHTGQNNRYNTLQFRDPGALSLRPWPCVSVESTGNRSGILIHCAAGFLMSIGCINLSRPLVNAHSDLIYDDSRARVITLINNMRTVLGGQFPSQNNLRIPTASLLVRDEAPAGGAAVSDVTLQPSIQTGPAVTTGVVGAVSGVTSPRGTGPSGTAAADLPDSWITVASNVTGHFEDSGDPFEGVSGNFDGQGISLGVLQWNIGQGSLPPLVTDCGQAVVNRCMPRFGADFWQACNVSIPEGLRIVGAWQPNNRLPASAVAELEAFMGSPEMLAVQLKTIRATAERAFRIATMEWCVPRGTGQPTLKEFCWFFDIVTQNGGLADVHFSDVQAFVAGHPGGGAVQFICDWLRNVQASPKIADDCAKNAKIWPALLADDDRDLFVMSHLRTLRARKTFWGVVMNRKGTLPVGKGRVNQEDFDLTIIFNKAPLS